MDDETTQTRTVAIELRDDGILAIRVLPDVDQSSDEAIENLVITRRLVGGKTVPVLVDLRIARAVDRATRQVYATRVDFASAQAMLVSSAFSRIAASIFIRIARPERRPTRMFTSEADAIQWLRGFLP